LQNVEYVTIVETTLGNTPRTTNQFTNIL